MGNRKAQCILIVVTLIVVNMAYGQSSKYTKQQKKDFLDADSYFVYGDFLTALDLFKKLEGADEEFKELHYKIGFSLFQLKRYDEAIPYLKQGSEYEKEAHYYLAQVYLRNAELSAAQKAADLYASLWTENNAKHTKQDAVFLQSQITTAREMMQQPEEVKIINLGEGINSAQHEYVPLIDGDESQLLFTSRRLTTTNGMSPYGQPYEDVYVSYRNEKGEWTEAIPVPGEVNSESNDACVGLSTDGQKLFLFKPNESLSGGDIYESDRIGDAWSKPILLDDHINQYNSIEASASIALDGKTIYFSSNREGGYGGFDLYRVVKLPNGEWSWPKNLGPEINTQRNEDSPFIDADGQTLYFSSQSHKNMGGYDVFQSHLNDSNKWSQPENLGYPINTTADDIHFVISANEKHGYYSSEKAEGFGGQDIYMIDYLERQLRQSIIRAQVIDSLGNPVESDISLINLETGELEGIYRSNTRDGKFIFLVNPDVEYDFLVEHEGGEYTDIILYTVEDLEKPQFKRITLN